MLYYGVPLRNSWHKYPTRFPTTCFGLMGPSSDTLGVFNRIFPSVTLPTLASVHTLGVSCMYGLSPLFVVKFIAYGISKILKYCITMSVDINVKLLSLCM
jgi:hypothetical protein